MPQKKSFEAMDRKLKEETQNGGEELVSYFWKIFDQDVHLSPKSTPADEINACLRKI